MSRVLPPRSLLRPHVRPYPHHALRSQGLTPPPPVSGVCSMVEARLSSGCVLWLVVCWFAVGFAFLPPCVHALRLAHHFYLSASARRSVVLSLGPAQLLWRLWSVLSCSLARLRCVLHCCASRSWGVHVFLRSARLLCRRFCPVALSGRSSLHPEVGFRLATETASLVPPPAYIAYFLRIAGLPPFRKGSPFGPVLLYVILS